jgi:thioredoxin-dependent peroxiredoxin
MAHLQQGDTAPSFEASDQNGKTFSLDDLRGQKVFVYFFPKANTSG